MPGTQSQLPFWGSGFSPVKSVSLARDFLWLSTLLAVAFKHICRGNILFYKQNLASPYPRPMCKTETRCTGICCSQSQAVGGRPPGQRTKSRPLTWLSRTFSPCLSSAPPIGLQPPPPPLSHPHHTPLLSFSAWAGLALGEALPSPLALSSSLNVRSFVTFSKKPFPRPWVERVTPSPTLLHTSVSQPALRPGLPTSQQHLPWLCRFTFSIGPHVSPSCSWASPGGDQAPFPHSRVGPGLPQLPCSQFTFPGPGFPLCVMGAAVISPPLCRRSGLAT